VASDGGIGMRHPRSAGTFPRVLGLFVRERHWISLPEAVRKMTLAPATRLKLADRGRIAPGAVADLVLFDAKTVRDRATFESPATPPAGVAKVFVDGQLVWDGGKPTGARPAKALPR
jgi:N-acyl-D-amino-acid deacylase